MKNLVQKGDVVVVPAPYDVNSGDLVVVGSIIGVAVTSALSGKSVPLANGGQVFDTLPKATGATWAVGDALYWDATAKKLTKVSTDNTLAAVATAVAATGDAVGAAKLRAIL